MIDTIKNNFETVESAKECVETVRKQSPRNTVGKLDKPNSEALRMNIISDYAKGMTVNQLYNKYKINYRAIKALLQTDVAKQKLNTLKTNIADKLEEIIQEMVQSIGVSIKQGELEKVSLAQRATVVGIFTDKMQLLRSKPTEIVQSDVPVKLADIVNYLGIKQVNQDVVEVKEVTQHIDN